ncbi:MAG: pitrilysin family protein [bacterium]|nr:pitrilysin family protein [bacterium]
MAKNSTLDLYQLDNGLRVVLVPMQGVQSVAVGVFVKTGSRYETAKDNGISHFVEHMVFKATKKLPTAKDTSRLEGLGAIQNAWTDVGATAYWCKIPADKWRDGLEVVKELALYPLFPQKDLDIERGVILEEMKRREDRPDELVQELLMKVMYGANPLGLATLGDPEVIKGITRNDFVDYHRRQYVPGRMVVVLAGRLEKISEIKSQIAAWFGSLPAKDGEEFPHIDDTQAKPALQVLPKKLANQAHLCLSFRGFNASDPRRFASTILTTHLGQGLSSRFFLELREKRGLCYAVRADEDRLEDVGIWNVYIGTGMSTLKEAIEATLKELTRAKNKSLTKAELGQAKQKVRGPVLFTMENPIYQMEFYARQVLDRPQEVLDYDTLLDRVMGVTVQEVQESAQTLFQTEKINLAVVGPVDKAQEKQLLKLLQV